MEGGWASGGGGGRIVWVGVGQYHNNDVRSNYNVVSQEPRLSFRRCLHYEKDFRLLWNLRRSPGTSTGYSLVRQPRHRSSAGWLIAMINPFKLM